jgi:hypothetical protein
MPILGLVLSHPDPARLADEIRALPGVLIVGAPAATKLPVAVEIAAVEPDRRAAEPLLDALRAIPGVALDIAYADLSDIHADR